MKQEITRRAHKARKKDRMKEKNANKVPSTCWAREFEEFPLWARSPISREVLLKKGHQRDQMCAMSEFVPPIEYLGILELRSYNLHADLVAIPLCLMSSAFFRIMIPDDIHFFPGVEAKNICQAVIFVVDPTVRRCTLPCVQWVSGRAILWLQGKLRRFPGLACP